MLCRVREWLERFAADDLSPEEILELRAREGTLLDDLREAKEGAKQFVKELFEPPVVIADATWWMTEGLDLREIEGITVPEEVIERLRRIKEDRGSAGEALELIERLQREAKIRITRDGMLETAFKAADEGKEVVILSSDPVLRKEARTKGIPVLFSLEQLYGDEVKILEEDDIESSALDPAYSALPGNAFHPLFPIDGDYPD